MFFVNPSAALTLGISQVEGLCSAIYRYQITTVLLLFCCSVVSDSLWCWRRLLKVPSARRSNQSILKEINPEYSLEGLMLKLRLQYFGHLMQRADSLGKILMLGKIEGRRKTG